MNLLWFLFFIKMESLETLQLYMGQGVGMAYK